MHHFASFCTQGPKRKHVRSNKVPTNESNNRKVNDSIRNPKAHQRSKLGSGKLSETWQEKGTCAPIGANKMNLVSEHYFKTRGTNIYKPTHPGHSTRKRQTPIKPTSQARCARDTKNEFQASGKSNSIG